MDEKPRRRLAPAPLPWNAVSRGDDANARPIAAWPFAKNGSVYGLFISSFSSFFLIGGYKKKKGLPFFHSHSHLAEGELDAKKTEREGKKKKGQENAFADDI